MVIGHDLSIIPMTLIVNLISLLIMDSQKYLYLRERTLRLERNLHMITILPLIMLKSSFLVIAKLKIAPDSWESDKLHWITFLIPKAYPHKNSKSNKSSYNPNPKLKNAESANNLDIKEGNARNLDISLHLKQ